MAVQRLLLLGVVAVLCTAVAVAPARAQPRRTAIAHPAATCSDYSNQAAAQRAADTRDADGDGIYCESLPCPCSTGSASPRTPHPRKPRRKRARRACVKPAEVQPVTFSAARYPNIRRHYRRALRKGWPSVLTVHRRHDARRRSKLLADIPAKPGFDRDEYPPAIGRATWRADVAYVPSRENRSHGASLGAQLRRFCAGTRFRYVFF